MFKLPDGWTFQVVDAKRPAYKKPSDFNDGRHFFLGHYELTDNASHVNGYDVYIRYWAERWKMQSAIGVFSPSDGENHKWMYYEFPALLTRKIDMASELIRQQFVNGDLWWICYNNGVNAEKIS